MATTAALVLGYRAAVSELGSIPVILDTDIGDDSDDSWLAALIENYKVWLPGASNMDPATDPGKISSTLFDTAAVYLAAEQDLVEMQDLPLRVTDDGYTVIDEVDGRIVHCATAWKDLPAYEKRLIDILTRIFHEQL